MTDSRGSDTVSMKGEHATGIEGQWALVAHNADKDCCVSCKEDEEMGYGMGADYCCCVHGDLYGYRYDDDPEIQWVHDGEKRWAEADAPR